MGIHEEYDLTPYADKLTNGVWVNYGEYKIKVTYAGKGNPKYLKTFAELVKPHKKMIERDSTSEVARKKSDEIMARLFSKVVLIDWEGVTNRDGTPLTYSEENCFQLLMELPQFLADVQEVAEELSVFRQQDLEDEAKNS